MLNRNLSAYHEAAHCIVGLHLNHEVLEVSIELDERAEGRADLLTDQTGAMAFGLSALSIDRSPGD
jgi:hypothetical protein